MSNRTKLIFLATFAFSSGVQLSETDWEWWDYAFLAVTVLLAFDLMRDLLHATEKADARKYVTNPDIDGKRIMVIGETELFTLRRELDRRGPGWVLMADDRDPHDFVAVWPDKTMQVTVP